MKVYTEVNYIWKDDKLVQTDSKSFEYDGEIESCHTKKHYGVNSPHSHGGVVEKLQNEASNAGDAFSGLYGGIIDQTTPGGSTKDFTDWAKNTSQKISHHAFGSSYPGGGSDGGGNSAADDDALALLKSSRRGIQGRGSKVKGDSDDNRRGLSNFNTKTLLTQGQKAKRLPKA